MSKEPGKNPLSFKLNFDNGLAPTQEDTLTLIPGGKPIKYSLWTRLKFLFTGKLY